MLMQFDSFRGELDRLAEQIMSGARPPRPCPMDAYRRGVERVAQEQLAGKRAVRALGGDHLIALSALETPLCLDRQDVLLDGEVDGPRVHAR